MKVNENLKSKFNSIMKNRLFRNFIVIFTGESMISILGMLNLIIIVNTIGLESNGKIIMIQTYATLFSSIFAFKSFQALIKFIAKSLENDDKKQAKEYIKLSYIFDIVACFIATIVSWISIDFMMRLMKWDLNMKVYIIIYTITILFSIQGTPIGILRIFNKFKYSVYSNVGVTVSRTIFYVAGIIIRADFIFFFIVEFVLAIVVNLVMIIMSFKVLKENELQDFYKTKIKLDKEFFKFNFYSNISSTIDVPVNQLTVFIMNSYLGFEGISVYRTFEKLGAVISKLGSPISQIIYPEMSTMIAKKDIEKARALSRKLFRGICGVGILAIIGIILTYKIWLPWFIPNAKEYILALIVYFIYIIYINAITGIHTLFMALNYIKYTIPMLLIINSIYLCLLYIFIIKMGMIGAILALLIQSVGVIVVKLMIMNKYQYQELL